VPSPRGRDTIASQADVEHRQPPPWASDGDEYDEVVVDGAPPGIVLRTDYSAGSDDAWAAFCSALRDVERELLAADQEPSTPAPAPAGGNDGDVEMAPASSLLLGTDANDEGEEQDDGSDEEGGDDDDDDDDDDGQLVLFTLVSDPARLSDISNLRALRLLFDVSVRSAPASTRGKHQHRLTGLRCLQETYDTRGRTLWIFDLRSRTDGCARLVSDAGDVATWVLPLHLLSSAADVVEK
jgi:hypothetical protein